MGCMSEDLVKNQFFSEFLSNSSSEDEGTTKDRAEEIRQRSRPALRGKKHHFYSLFQGQVSDIRA